MCDDLDQIAETNEPLNESTARPVTHQVLTNRDHSRALVGTFLVKGMDHSTPIFSQLWGLKNRH